MSWLIQGPRSQVLGIFIPRKCLFLMLSVLISIALAVSNIRKWFNSLFDLSTEFPCSILMLPSVGFARTRRSSRRFLVSSGATRTSTVSAFMELNLAVPTLQGGVLRSAISSLQTSERSHGPTFPLSYSDVSPTCLSSSLGRSKYL